MVRIILVYNHLGNSHSFFMYFLIFVFIFCVVVLESWELEGVPRYTGIIRRQLAGIVSLLSLCELWGLNSGSQASEKVPLPS